MRMTRRASTSTGIRDFVQVSSLSSVRPRPHDLRERRIGDPVLVPRPFEAHVGERLEQDHMATSQSSPQTQAKRRLVDVPIVGFTRVLGR